MHQHLGAAAIHEQDLEEVCGRTGVQPAGHVVLALEEHHRDPCGSERRRTNRVAFTAAGVHALAAIWYEGAWGGFSATERETRENESESESESE